MKIRVKRFELRKRYPLTISRGTSSGSKNLLVEVEAEGVTGVGEMAPTSGGDAPETAAAAEAAFETWAPLLAGLSPWQGQCIERLWDRNPLSRAAWAALDCALYDWRGKRVGLPVWKLLGLDRDSIPVTSITIGITAPAAIQERVPEIMERTGARALKIKMGSPDGEEADRAALEAAQAAAPAGTAWRVDANGGWEPETAIRMLRWLAARGVEFVEQPLARGRDVELAGIRAGSPLPIYLDESIQIALDVPRVAPVIDGVNLKLMKCGGISEALRIIATARAHGLKVMMGCMSESSLAITAAAHISPLADALDLDSHLNLQPDPFVGALLVDGRIVPGDAPGLGVRERTGSDAAG